MAVHRTARREWPDAVEPAVEDAAGRVTPRRYRIPIRGERSVRRAVFVPSASKTRPLLEPSPAAVSRVGAAEQAIWRRSVDSATRATPDTNTRLLP